MASKTIRASFVFASTEARRPRTQGVIVPGRIGVFLELRYEGPIGVRSRGNRIEVHLTPSYLLNHDDVGHG